MCHHNNVILIFFRNRHHLIRLQYSTFRRQSISSTAVLGIALIITFYLVNFSVSYNYDSGVILDNSDFNMLIWIIAGIGSFSVFLSVKPSWIKLFRSMNEKITKLDRLNSLDEPNANCRRYPEMSIYPCHKWYTSQGNLSLTYLYFVILENLFLKNQKGYPQV